MKLYIQLVHVNTLKFYFQILFCCIFCSLSAAKELSESIVNENFPKDLEKSDWNSIRAVHQEWQYEFKQHGYGCIARNIKQEWTTLFDGKGFIAKPDGADWTWGLALLRYGFDDHLNSTVGCAKITTSGQNLSYEWNNDLKEWFINDSRGLEHGFLLAKRPPGYEAGKMLTFTISTLGGLRPSLSSDAKAIHFINAENVTVVNYSGLKVWDAEGKVLDSNFKLDGSEIHLLINESDAIYPLTIDPIAQQALLKAANRGSNDHFGYSVAVSGNTVVVGAPLEDSGTSGANSVPNENSPDSGAAYVFVKSGGVWSQQAYLKAFNTDTDDKFGCSVSISGDTIVIGAEDEDSSSTGINSTPNQNAGSAGAAYIFVRVNTTWTQQAYLKASNSQSVDRFGASVAVSGDTVVVGAIYEDSAVTGVNGNQLNENATNSGAAYVFVRQANNWIQQAYLKPFSVGFDGAANDEFGHSVAISNDTIVVGVPFEDSLTSGINGTPNVGAPDAGAAYVFNRSLGVWSESAYIKPSNPGANDWFGKSVAIDDATIIVGAQAEDGGSTGINGANNNNKLDAGAAYIFTYSGNAWSQQAYIKASATEPDEYFGRSVAISGDAIIVGAGYVYNDAGSVYVFVRNNSTWSQQTILSSSGPETTNLFGFSVAMAGEIVFVGDISEDSAATDSGAVYIFSGLGLGGFNTWAKNNAVGGANADDDNDGIKNAIEYVLGTNPKSFTLNAISSHIVNEYIFSFKRSDFAETSDVTLWVETSNDLVNWNADGGPHLVGASSSGAVLVVENSLSPSADPGYDIVTLAVSKNSPKKFARIRCEIAP